MKGKAVKGAKAAPRGGNDDGSSAAQERQQRREKKQQVRGCSHGMPAWASSQLLLSARLQAYAVLPHPHMFHIRVDPCTPVQLLRQAFFLRDFLPAAPPQPDAPL